jgi:hypothetical protein
MLFLAAALKGWLETSRQQPESMAAQESDKLEISLEPISKLLVAVDRL